MSESSLSNTLRTLASKLDGIQEVLNGAGRAPPTLPSQSGYNFLNSTIPTLDYPKSSLVLQRLDTLSGQVDELRRNVAFLRSQQQQPVPTVSSNPVSILPVHPMHGIEVVPKREVVLSEENVHSLSVADRLLLNKDAKKALEAQEMGASRDDEYPLGEDEEEHEDTHTHTHTRTHTHTHTPHHTMSMQLQKMDVEMEISGVSQMEEDEAEAEKAEEAEAEAGEEAEEAEAEEAEAEEEEAEAEEEEAEEEEAEEEELTEFEYKGNTFYRDSENNVFMTDEDGDLVADPIGSWNPEKNRIVMKKA